MAAQILDGKKLAQTIQPKIAKQVKKLIVQNFRAPSLAVIMVGNDPASKIYVDKKHQMCQKLGITSKSYPLTKDFPESKLLTLIDQLNKNPKIDGILVQLPLPNHINSNKILNQISPSKDVDGFHPYNIGKLSIGQPALRPCTPKGIMAMLHATQVNLVGKHAVVIGSSNIVGKPMAMELINAMCTVTICQHTTQNLPVFTQQADILISATGVPNLIIKEWIKPESIVIDVGIKRLSNNKIVGDVDFQQAKKVAGWITPVPGGVGPMTVISLMENTLYAATKNLLSIH